MNHIFSLDYWTQTWIVQEFLLAKHVEILCGLEALDLKLLNEFFADLFEGTIKDMQKKNTVEFVDTHALLENKPATISRDKTCGGNLLAGI